jgi:hypothetical protein
MRVLPHISPLTIALAAAFVTGCGTNSAAPTLANLPGNSATGEQMLRGASPDAKSVKLIALNPANEKLEYWPIEPNGGRKLTPLSASLGVSEVTALAGDGNVVSMAVYNPAEILSYNIKTKATSTLSDPYGAPIDIAIGKDHTIYALNYRNVAVFSAGSSPPKELTCSDISEGDAIAVDNEGDVFVGGYGGAAFSGVVEFPAGSTVCQIVPLRKTSGYIGGVGIDPKTDALIAVDNPGDCASGLEGRMRIYSKPYGHKAAVQRNLKATYCAGTFRLDATSSLIFLQDASVSAGTPFIDQRTYPGGKRSGTYRHGSFGSTGNPIGFTTIPNTLPN